MSNTIGSTSVSISFVRLVLKSCEGEPVFNLLKILKSKKKKKQQKHHQHGHIHRTLDGLCRRVLADRYWLRRPRRTAAARRP